MPSFNHQVAGARSSFRSLVESLPLAACICDWTTLAVSHANAESARIFGYAREQLPRLTLRDSCAVAEAKGALDLLLQQASAGNASNGPVRVRGCRRRDGTTANLGVWLRSLLLDGRRALLVVAQDIAEGLRVHCLPCQPFVAPVARIDLDEPFVAMHARALQALAGHCGAAIVKSFHYRRVAREAAQAA